MALEHARGGIPGSGRDLQVLLTGGERQARADRLGQLRPQEHAAGREDIAPLREPPVERTGERVPPAADHGPALDQDLVEVPEHVRGDELLEHRARHVAGGAGGHQTVDQRGVAASPPDPEPSPDRLAQRADRDRALVAEARRRRRHLDAVEVELDERLVDHHDRSRRTKRAQRTPAGCFIDQHPGGIVEVRHQVRERRTAAPRCRDKRVQIPPLARHGHRREERGGASQSVERDRVAGNLHEHMPAAWERRPDRQIDPVHRPIRDEDLLGPRGQATAIEPGGDRAAQRRQSERVVAVVVEPARELASRLTEQVFEHRRRRQRGDPHVEPGTSDDRIGRRPVSSRERHPAPRPLPARDVALTAQLVVRGGHRGPAHAERGREGPLGGQPALDRDLAVEDQRPQRRGEPLTARAFAPPRPEELGETADWGDRHKPLLANWPANA